MYGGFQLTPSLVQKNHKLQYNFKQVTVELSEKLSYLVTANCLSGMEPAKANSQ